MRLAGTFIKKKYVFFFFRKYSCFGPEVFRPTILFWCADGDRDEMPRKHQPAGRSVGWRGAVARVAKRR